MISQTQTLTAFLARRRIVTHGEINAVIWPGRAPGSDKHRHVIVHRARKRLAEQGQSVTPLYNWGYRISAPAKVPA